MYHYTNYPLTLEGKSFVFSPTVNKFNAFRLKKLQKLELRDNYLNSLPVTFGELASLEFLDLGGNDFVTMVC